MRQVLQQVTPVARKEYDCNACSFLREHINDISFTMAELRQIVKAKKAGWKIQKGQQYIRLHYIGNDGDRYTFRAIPEIDEICSKYELYPEWEE